MLERLAEKLNGSIKQDCSPFQAPKEDNRMPEYQNGMGGGNGNGGTRIGLREGILAGIVTFCACGAVFYFVITGMITTNSPYMKDKELIFQNLQDNAEDIKETKQDIKNINERLYEIKLEVNKANNYLYKLSEKN